VRFIFSSLGCSANAERICSTWHHPNCIPLGRTWLAAQTGCTNARRNRASRRSTSHEEESKVPSPRDDLGDRWVSAPTFFCSTSQLVPHITTSNNWYSCGHYNVSLATILHYNLQGHNTAANITMLTFFCSTSQLVPHITTSNNWCSCGHYNVSLATILHYNLLGHNTAANITMLTCFYFTSQLVLLCKHHNVYQLPCCITMSTQCEVTMLL
jgi:hypothetical protein